MQKDHVLVIDPAGKHPELDAFNQIAKMSPVPCTYHLPKLHGMLSFAKETNDADNGLIKAIIIFGSATSVHERAQWQIDLEKFCLPLFEQGLPTLGLCYGHQMLAYMFGGKIDYLYDDHKKLRGFRQITLHDNAVFGACSGDVVVSHNETVRELPADFEVIGDSADVATDVIMHKKLPLISFQSHPEASDQFLTNNGIEQPDNPARFGFGNSLVQKFLNHYVN